MRYRLPALVPLLLVAALLAIHAGAEEPAPPAKPTTCRDEIAALCPDTQPGSLDRRRCARDRASELSETCRARVEAFHHAGTAGIEALRQSCGSEIDEHCDEVRRGSGRLLRCLEGLDAEQRSQGCTAYLDMLAQKRAEARKAGKGAP